jgi:hypothetical protein
MVAGLAMHGEGAGVGGELDLAGRQGGQELGEDLAGHQDGAVVAAVDLDGGLGGALEVGGDQPQPVAVQLGEDAAQGGKEGVGGGRSDGPGDRGSEGGLISGEAHQGPSLLGVVGLRSDRHHINKENGS